MPRRTPTARLARVVVLALSPALAAATAAGCGTTEPPKKPAPPGQQPSGQARGCAQSTLDGMGERARAAQLFMVGVSANGPSPADLAEIARTGPGGVYYSGRSKAGVEAVSRISSDLQQRATATSRGVQLFVGVDQEGGKVQPLAGPGFTPIPPATMQGQWSPEQMREAASTWGRELRSAGINVDLAPIADTLAPEVGKANPAIGKYDRAFSSDPAVVSSHVRAFVEGMRSAGVSSSAKHFPGLGRVHGNTDVHEHVTDEVTTAHDPYLAPFEEAVRSDSAFMMSSSATYPKIDPAHRAVFSPAVLQGQLRDRLGYQGMIISDDLGQAKEVSSVPAGQRAVDFVTAGGNVVLTASPRTVSPMIDALIDRAHRDPGFAAKLHAAEQRVLGAKAAQGMLPCSTTQ